MSVHEAQGSWGQSHDRGSGAGTVPCRDPGKKEGEASKAVQVQPSSGASVLKAAGRALWGASPQNSKGHCACCFTGAPAVPKGLRTVP